MDVKEIHEILCPIDFSDFSRHALDHAIAIAHWSGARVTALHVPVLAIEDALFVGAAGLPPFALTESDREELRARMRTFVTGECGSAARVDVLLRESSDISAQILHEAKALNADLLVIGTHGRSGFDRLVLGSVTEKILRKAACPILTIPRRAPDSVPAGAPPYARILCGVDFSDCSLAALAYAFQFANQGAEWLGVVHAVELQAGFSESENACATATLQRDIENDAKSRLARLLPASGTGAHCYQVDPIIRTGKPYQELLRVAASHRADLIILGVQGRGVLNRMLFGSTTDHVIRQAACPVLTIRS